MGTILMVALSYLVGQIVPVLCAKYLPNSLLKKWGIALGRSFSKFGRKAVTVDAWEKIENTLTAGIVSIANGIQEGADFDDA